MEGKARQNPSAPRQLYGENSERYFCKIGSSSPQAHFPHYHVLASIKYARQDQLTNLSNLQMIDKLQERWEENKGHYLEKAIFITVFVIVF